MKRHGRHCHHEGFGRGFEDRRAFFAEAMAEAGMLGRGGWHERGGGRGRGDMFFGRGPGRGERPLEQGDLKWLVLDLINAQPRHGYEIIKAIEEDMNGAYAPSPGVVYPTLTFLEETGLVESEAHGNKKLYRITEEGKSALAENEESLQHIRERMNDVRGRLGGPPAPELRRAMENLRGALQVRMSKGQISPKSLAAITAAIDRAASEIERS